jgi:putative ABC transport system permease protein
VIVLALALGIGVNASSFITVSALVFHPLPFPRIERLMTVWETVPRLRSERDTVAAANFLDWRQQSRAFEGLAAYQVSNVNLTGLGEPERLQACSVSSGYFAVLGRKPALGRAFRADESEPGHALTAIVSHGFWQRHFAGTADVLGRGLSLNGQTFTIAGVMPPDFDFPLGTDVWMPLAMTPAEGNDRAHGELAVIGRLKPDVPVSRARAEMDGLSRRLEAQYPGTNEGRGVLIVPILELTNNVTDRFVLTLMATAGFVLLLACANIANLQLARIEARRKEMAVRTALGAGRLSIMRQLVAENVLLALAGGALGLVLVDWDLAYMRSSIPAQVRKWVAGFAEMRIDSSVVLFTLAASVFAGILCALPSFITIVRRRSMLNVGDALKESSRGSSAGPRRSRTGNVLAAGEVALALFLLVGAGLMVRTFQRFLTINAGFNPDHLLTAQIALPETRYPSGVQIASFYGNLVRELQAAPDVQAAGVSASGGAAEGVYIEGREAPRPDEPRPSVRSVGGQFFAAYGLSILNGRAIGAQDDRDTAPVAVVSQSVASHFWPAGDAVGRHIRVRKDDSSWLTVVGICGDVKEWFSGQPQPAVYLALPQAPGPDATVLVRTLGDPALAAAPVRAAVHRLDASQPVFDVKSMQQSISEQTSGVRASAGTMTTYAVLALLLAVTGIYAVVSYSVAQRTHEIGLRIALGAEASQVVKMTLRQAVGIAAAGLAIGVPVSVVFMRIMSGVLYNVVLIEPLVFTALTAMLAAAVILAGYIPARRAAAIDPLAAMREE